MSRRRRDAPPGPVTGVLLVDKPASMTSHDVVSHVRRTFHTRRVGHAGTLDPMATGVLVLLLGEATKLSSVLTTQSKEYEARISLGIETDSLDADGQIVARREVPVDWNTETQLEAALWGERQRTLQIPPAVSAIKVDGQRSYRLARTGQSVDLDPRPVEVHDLEVLKTGPNWLDVRLRVSKGYYVRSLARDLAARLGTIAHLTALRRTKSGAFGTDRATALPLTGPVPLLALHDAVRGTLPCVQVSEEDAAALSQGKPLARGAVLEAPNNLTGVCAALAGDRLVALIEHDENLQLFRVRRGILDPGPERRLAESLALQDRPVDSASK